MPEYTETDEQESSLGEYGFCKTPGCLMVGAHFSSECFNEEEYQDMVDFQAGIEPEEGRVP